MINMSVKMVEGDDFEQIVPWWKFWWRGMEVPKFILSDTGLLVHDYSDKIAAGWLFLPKNGKIAWMDWIVANPLVSREKREAALQLLMDSCANLAQSEDCLYLYSATKHNFLSKHMLNNDFKIMEEGVSLFYRELC